MKYNRRRCSAPGLPTARRLRNPRRTNRAAARSRCFEKAAGWSAWCRLKPSTTRRREQFLDIALVQRVGRNTLATRGLRTTRRQHHMVGSEGPANCPKNVVWKWITWTRLASNTPAKMQNPANPAATPTRWWCPFGHRDQGRCCTPGLGRRRRCRRLEGAMARENVTNGHVSKVVPRRTQNVLNDMSSTGFRERRGEQSGLNPPTTRLFPRPRLRHGNSETSRPPQP